MGWGVLEHRSPGVTKGSLKTEEKRKGKKRKKGKEMKRKRRRTKKKKRERKVNQPDETRPFRCAVRPQFCRDKTPEFVWAPQAKGMHQIVRIEFENCIFVNI